MGLPREAPPRWNSLVAMTRDCKSLGFGLRRFESYFQHHNLVDAVLAQLVEQPPCKRQVVGAEPTHGSIFVF